MFENLMNFFKKFSKKDKNKESSNAAKERLHLVLMQDRANVSADFLDLMKQEIIDVIKKYIEVDEGAIDVRLTNKDNGDGTTGAPALYANIPITKIKEDLKLTNQEEKKESDKAQKESNEKTKKNVSQIKKDTKKEEINDKINADNENIDNKKEKEEKNENNNEEEKKSEKVETSST